MQTVPTKSSVSEDNPLEERMVRGSGSSQEQKPELRQMREKKDTQAGKAVPRSNWPEVRAEQQDRVTCLRTPRGQVTVMAAFRVFSPKISLTTHPALAATNMIPNTPSISAPYQMQKQKQR